MICKCVKVDTKLDLIFNKCQASIRNTNASVSLKL